MRTIAQVDADIQAIVDAVGELTFSDDQLASVETLEAERESIRKSGEVFSRIQARRAIVIDGMAPIIAATPKGDAALDFAFSQYLRTGFPNADIAQLFAQSEGSNTAGGYAVPDTFRNKLTETKKAFGGLMAAAEQLPTADGSAMRWPTNNDTSDSEADVVAEGASSAAGADLVFGEVTLGAYRYASTGTGNNPVKVSVELLQDSAFPIDDFVSRKLGERIHRKQAKDIMQASGSGAPQGLLYGTHTGTVALAGGDAITFAKLNKLKHSIDVAYREGGNCSWIFNDTTMEAIEEIVDGNGRPILVSSLNGIEGSISRPTLLGYPVIIDNSAFDKANQVNFAAFGDLRQAYIVRQVRDVQVLVNPYSSPGYVQYDAWARLDGKIQDSAAVATLEGTT